MTMASKVLDRIWPVVIWLPRMEIVCQALTV